MPDNDLPVLAQKVLETLRQSGRRLVTVESCTGGLISATLSDLPGSSEVLEGSFVTYSNDLKTSAVGVPETILRLFGAVSLQTAEAMARGGLSHALNADLALSVTGIAGPGGGTISKPVGTVCFALASRSGLAISVQKHFMGDRQTVRRLSVREALLMVLES
ncbi:CinA family protein [Gluconobacter kanchanaburiensis]|uniref:Competence damage-inducible protein A n=1 Tax=Gluconobacter kanchanaburiensis NBRC 103587 TaxID=1307948 RepID=A0A511BAC2_9PROT|nr:CinA family protein [Gluconobacter kanchanaburiensis]MBF0862560.1 CinA family protein [Gluconobacter kanchanaburiensis]GBR71666.1 hypothetical protein AA103587_2495 [Gluconobacter kanchanaburiensis NBRC 103587]GEK96682.1 competence damage-inducible protein A [Gluconobacter kanchanaburiensis NBRC 103587]